MLRNKARFISLSVFRISYIYIPLAFIHHIWLYLIIFNRSGDIEINPGPKSNSYQSFSIFHWNLNRISVHNFLRLSLLRAYIKSDVVCLSETYLDSSILHDDDHLQILGYNLYREDHSLNVKSGVVCIYYNISLPLNVKNIRYLQECINFEIKIKDKLCNFITLYRSPNQSQDDFESFINNFELNLDSVMVNNPFLTVVLGDFNATSSLWYNRDITTYEVSKIDGAASQFGLEKIIKEPTHIIGDSSLCIDLIFTTQPNLVMEPGVHSSLHSNCHHHITFAKLNLKIYYPPPYERDVWHYQKANVDQIRQAIIEFPWGNRFPNINLNEQVQLFTQTFQNIISNYISHETITCDDRNPPWIDEKIKKLVLHKNRGFNAYSRDKNNTDLFNKIPSLQAHLKTSTEESKQNYYSRLSNKLLDSKTSPKSYCSILKAFLNNKKIPCIPPLLRNGKFIMDFKEKAELFNDFFTRQCSLVNNNSKPPSVLTKKRASHFQQFSTYDILKIIRNLNRHDMISVCDESICKPLGIIFQSCLQNGKFPSEWKKANVVLVFKKKNKKNKK